MDRERDASIEGNPDHDTPGGRDAEPVENLPDVGTTTPDAYPLSAREDSEPDAKR